MGGRARSADSPTPFLVIDCPLCTVAEVAWVSLRVPKPCHVRTLLVLRHGRGARRWPWRSRGTLPSRPLQSFAHTRSRGASDTSSVPALSSADAALCGQSDDCFDALIASLVARAAALDLCESIPLDDRAAATREGWIALPSSDSLGQLAKVGLTSSKRVSGKQAGTVTPQPLSRDRSVSHRKK